jgi:opacity protein-like surface antigen
MKIKLACLGLGALLAATGSAQAGDFSFGAGLKDRDGIDMPAYGIGLRDRVEVPAPIPVPAPMPVPEGFTYYLRADLGWSFAADPSFSETGAAYGATPLTYSGLSNRSVSGDDGALVGTIGAGAYLTPRFRGDLTLDFLAEQTVGATATYTDPGPVNGLVSDNLKVSRVVGLVNAYWDLLPRGAITPYIGAGIGLVYNDIDRTHVTTDDTPATLKTGSSKGTNVGLAAALMAGTSFSFNHEWAIDVSYRALYLEGGSVTTTLSSAEVSKVTIGDVWEHQVRVGLRFNIW